MSRSRDKNNLLTVTNPRHGNLSTEKYYNKFKLFLNAYNTKYNTKIPFIIQQHNPSLNDAWLCGFSDAEDCFTKSILDGTNRKK